MDEKDTLQITDKDLLIIKAEEDSGIEYRERKHDDWTDNYTLYRDKVITNRLTQRQTVNIPLMKYVLNTQLKEMMDAPQLYFPNLNNDQQKEVYYNEYWKETARINSLVIRDHVDKKQNALFGRSFKKLNILDGKVSITLRDPQDMIVHRFVDPTDIDTAPSLIETGIFVTLDDITENEDYDAQAVKELNMYFTSESGNLESDENFDRASEKSDRLRNIGDEHVEDPILGETYVELHEVYRFEYSKSYDKKLIFRYVIASTKAGMFKLHKIEFCDLFPKKLKDNFWHDHFPYTSWAGDPESTDFWSDGVADSIRPLNKVLNVWISQLVENRTLQNFGMKYYDSTDKKFMPQTFSPQPFGHYPTPGDPNKIIKDVMVGNLTGTLEEMTFLIGIAEKATASAGTNSGAVEQRDVTLGEVKYALANAQKRILIQQVFYTEDWKDLGLKYNKMVEAGGSMLDPITIFKRGRLGKKMYKKELSPKDWETAEGYITEVKTIADKQGEDIDAVEKLNMVKAEMPMNVPLVTIYRRKLMELSGLSPDEISQVEEFEKQKAGLPQPDMATATTPGAQGQQPQQGAQGLPQVPDIAPKPLQ